MSDTPALDAFREKMRGMPKKPKQVDTRPCGTIMIRKQVMIPTPGSQRRCYNGCFPSSDWGKVWSDWETFLHNQTEEDLEFWNRGRRAGTQLKLILKEYS